MKSEIVDVNETRRDLTIEVPSEVVNEAIGNAAAEGAVNFGLTMLL